MSAGKTRRRFAAGVAAAAMVLGACSWRVETPPPEITPPGPDEMARDALARELAELRTAFEDVTVKTALLSPGDTTVALGQPDGSGGDALVLAHVEAVLVRHEDAVGPVYVQYPGVTPTPSATLTGGASPSPSATPEDAGGGTVREHAMRVRDTALVLAAETADPALALLFASIGTSYAFALARADHADAVAAYEAALAGPGDAAATPAEEGEPGAAPADPNATIITDETPVLERVADRGLGDAPPAGFESAVPSAQDLDALAAAGVDVGSLLVLHDYATFVYEFARARFGGGARTADSALREDIHVRRLEALVAATGEDPRGIGYAIDAAEAAERNDIHELVLETEAAVEAGYLAAFVAAVGAGEADAGAWLLVAAVDAHVAQFAWASPEGFGPPPVEAFPGVAVSAPPEPSQAPSPTLSP